MITIAPRPSSFEPPVVKMMAKELPPVAGAECVSGNCLPLPQQVNNTRLAGSGDLSIGWKFLLIGGGLVLLYLSYRGCQKRGAC